MPTLSKILWAAFAGFSAWVVFSSREPHSFVTAGPLGLVRLVVWAAFFAFTGYSFYCSFREDLFQTIRKMTKLYWGRQIGLDLYLGLALSLLIIYLNEGSLWSLLIWLVPVIVFANQVTLLYFAVHFDSIIAKLAPIAGSH